MNIIPGHGLLLKIPFADGAPCINNRPFLVINTNIEKKSIELLNVSSIRGKEHKILFDSNEVIYNYKPPFKFPSFVKLDALYTIEYFPELESKITHNGDTIHPDEFRRIIDRFYAYRFTNDILTASYNQDDIKSLNFT